MIRYATRQVRYGQQISNIFCSNILNVVKGKELIIIQNYIVLKMKQKEKEINRWHL